MLDAACTHLVTERSSAEMVQLARFLSSGVIYWHPQNIRGVFLDFGIDIDTINLEPYLDTV